MPETKVYTLPGKPAEVTSRSIACTMPNGAVKKVHIYGIAKDCYSVDAGDGLDIEKDINKEGNRVIYRVNNDEVLCVGKDPNKILRAVYKRKQRVTIPVIPLSEEEQEWFTGILTQLEGEKSIRFWD